MKNCAPVTPTNSDIRISKVKFWFLRLFFLTKVRYPSKLKSIGRPIINNTLNFGIISTIRVFIKYRNIEKDFREEFYKMWDRIMNNKSLAFARYGDGEVIVMKGIRAGPTSNINVVDGWSCPNGLTKLGRDLLYSLKHKEPQYYYGIPCQCCNEEAKRFVLNYLLCRKDNITYANLFVNSNYPLFLENIKTIKEKVIIIANKNANISGLPFEVGDFYPIPDDCVIYYENHKDELIKDLRQFKEYKNRLFFLSAGPLAKVIIDILFMQNKDNRYVDTGSTLDPFLLGHKSRTYMDPKSIYAQRVCIL